MCNGCRNKYPLGPYYFQEYKPYVTEAEVERVRQESRVDYIDPAKRSAECFEKYYAEKLEEDAAEHGLPEDASPQGILANVPEYDACAAFQSPTRTRRQFFLRGFRLGQTYHIVARATKRVG